MGNGETGIPVWLSNLVINIPLFICGYFLLEKKSMIRTAYTTAVSTVFMAAIPTFPLATQDKLLNMILGGVMFGCAYGLMFRQNASSGGVDLMALILNHLRHDIGAPLFLGGSIWRSLWQADWHLDLKICCMQLLRLRYRQNYPM